MSKIIVDVARGFDVITKAGKVYDYDIMPKSRLAEIILDHMHEL